MMISLLLSLAFTVSLTFAQESGSLPEQPLENQMPPPPPASAEVSAPTGNQMSETAMEDAVPPSVFDIPAGESLVSRLTKPFDYEREGKRDPFRLPAAKVTPLQPGALFGPFLPLQEVKLADVTVKGIVLDSVSPKALIAVKGEKTEMHRIAVGDYLGEDFGVVQAIRDGQVIIVQTFGEGNKKSTTTRTLYIRK